MSGAIAAIKPTATAWRTAKLGDVLNVQNGYAFPSKQFSKTDGTPLIRIRDLKAGDATSVGYIGDYDKAYVVHNGDLLIGMDGDFVCHEWAGGDALLNQRVCRLIDFSDAVEPRFIFYGINKFLNEIQDATTFTTVKHLSSKKIKAIDFPLPPLDEQKRIVAVLDQAFAALDRARDHVQTNIDNSVLLFESWLQSVFNLGEQSWPMRPLSQIAENLDRKRVPITKKDRQQGTIPYYGASGVVDYVADYIFDEVLLLISEDGANLLARTYPIAFSISGKSWVNNHAHVLRFDDLDSQEFVRLYLNSITIAPYVSGMAQPKLNQNALGGIHIPYPPFEERKRIVAEAAAIWHRTQAANDNYERQSLDISTLGQSLLKRAFAGQLT